MSYYYYEEGDDVTIEELEKAEAEWREAVESQVNSLDFLDGLPPLEEVDGGWAADMAQKAQDVACDVEEWSKVVNALLKAKEAAKKPKLELV